MSVTLYPGQRSPLLDDLPRKMIHSALGAHSTYERNKSISQLIDVYLSAIEVGGKRYVMSRDDFRSQLANCWTACEWPGRFRGIQWWLDYAKFFTTTVDGEFGEAQNPELVFEKPADGEIFHLYRAAVNKGGYSWTPDKEVAMWFHKRNRDFFKLKGAVLYEADVPGDAVYGRVLGREGEEFIVNPRKVRNRAIASDAPIDYRERRKGWKK